MTFYLVEYNRRVSGKQTFMQIPADTAEAARKRFIEYWTEEEKPVPEIISIKKDTKFKDKS